MICIKSITWPSTVKWALNQPPANRLNNLFLVEKLRKFIILPHILIAALFCKLHIKNPLCISLVYFLRTFEKYLKTITTRINKLIRLLRKLWNIFPKPVLNTKIKVFVRQNLDYGDVIYDEAYNKKFHQKLESVQYNACLTL